MELDEVPDPVGVACERLKEAASARNPDANGGVFGSSGELGLVFQEDHFVDGFFVGGLDDARADQLGRVEVRVVLRD